MSSVGFECDVCEAPIQGQCYDICQFCREMTCRVCNCSCGDDIPEELDFTMEDQINREKVMYDE